MAPTNSGRQARTSKDQEDVMIDEFDRQWVDLVRRVEWIEALYALIGLTRLGERPTTLQQLAAALERPEEEAIKLAWEASRVRPDGDGRIYLDTPWPGASPRRRLYVGERDMAVSGCAPDLFGVAAVLDVPFRVEDACSVTGVPIRIGFASGRVERVDPPETVAVLLPPRRRTGSTGWRSSRSTPTCASCSRSLPPPWPHRDGSATTPAAACSLWRRWSTGPSSP